MVLAALERGAASAVDPPESQAEVTPSGVDEQPTLAGMLGVRRAAESMVRDVGWTMMDIGKRIERGLG
jgi:uncharacterized alpha-E superfamily protein